MSNARPPLNTLRQLARRLINRPQDLNDGVCGSFEQPWIHRHLPHLTGPAVDHTTRLQQQPKLLPGKVAKILQVIQPGLLTDNRQVLELHHPLPANVCDLLLLAGLEVGNSAGCEGREQKRHHGQPHLLAVCEQGDDLLLLDRIDPRPSGPSPSPAHWSNPLHRS